MSMHLLMASRTTPFHSIGGMQSIAWDLAREFTRQGHKVTFLTTATRGGPSAGLHMLEGVNMVFLAGTTPEVYDRKWWRASQQYVLQGLAQEVDAVLSVSAAAASLLPLRERFRPGVKFLFQAHGTSWGEAVSKWRTGQAMAIAKSVKNLYWLFKDATIYPRFDHIVAVGDELGESFRHRPLTWMTGGAQCSTIANGVNTHFFGFDDAKRQTTRQTLGLPAHARVVLFAARLHPQKGCMEALAAFKRLLERNDSTTRDLRMLIVGHGEETSRLQQACATDANLSARVLMTGAVERSQMPGLMAASDLFLFPTLRKEGLPMNVLEALASGLPVITAPSLRSMLRELDVSYADPRSADAMADAMALELQHPAPTHRAPRIPANYTLQHCATRYMATLAPGVRA
jgi:glycosyltransferase involved in cell wall biosynthesis